LAGTGNFRVLNPRLRFYARSNYAEELAREVDAPRVFEKLFFGERFNLDDVSLNEALLDVLLKGHFVIRLRLGQWAGTGRVQTAASLLKSAAFGVPSCPSTQSDLHAI
jgi:hypothetical protein